MKVYILESENIEDDYGCQNFEGVFSNLELAIVCADNNNINRFVENDIIPLDFEINGVETYWAKSPYNAWLYYNIFITEIDQYDS